MTRWVSILVLGLALLVPERVVAFSPSLHLDAQPPLLRQGYAARALHLNQRVGEPFAAKAELFAPATLPTSGTAQVLVIPMDFPDLPANGDRTDEIAYWQDLVFGEDAEGEGPYPFQSFRQYYLRESFGALQLEGTVLPWKTADNNSTYYARKFGGGLSRCYGLGSKEESPGVCSLNEDCLEDGGAAALVAEALNYAADAGEDLDTYDNDGDGVLDSIVVLHAGPNAEMTSDCDDLWSHQYYGTFDVNGSDVEAAYIIVPERYFCPSGLCASADVGETPAALGVLAHEFGHLLGLPDLYASEGQGNGVGVFSGMSWGIYGDGSVENEGWGPEQAPAGIDPWSCVVMGWCTPTVIAENACNYELKPLTTGTEIVRIDLGDSGDEYYLLAFLPPQDNWKVTGTMGVSIYHADDSQANPSRRNIVSCVPDEEECDGLHYWVSYEQSDGNFDLENGINRGETDDLWQLFDSFKASGRPSSCGWDGTTCNASVYVKSLLSDKATLRIIVDSEDLPPAPQLLAVPTADELNAQVGRPYQFVPQLLTGQSADLRWHLAAAPRGMTIDEKTGVIDWIPESDQADAFDVRLVIDNCAGEFTQSWKVVVSKGGKGCGVGEGGQLWVLILIGGLVAGALRRRSVVRNRT